MNSKSIMTQSLNTMGLTVMMLNLFFFFFNDCYPLWVHRPPVQLSVARATPSHSRPPCLGSGAVHSLPRCLSQSELHTDHSPHSLQPPSTEGIRYKYKSLRIRGRTYTDWATFSSLNHSRLHTKYERTKQKRRYTGEQNQLTWQRSSLFLLKVQLSSLGWFS